MYFNKNGAGWVINGPGRISNKRARAYMGNKRAGAYMGNKRAKLINGKIYNRGLYGPGRI